jgi:hypothetical protein
MRWKRFWPWWQRIEFVRAVAFTPDAPALYSSVYAKLGETDQAFEWLERAYLERSSWMTVLKSDPRFESLRSDPRYIDLLRSLGLE